MNSDKPVLLVVDDTPTSVELLHAILRDDFQIKVATNGDRAVAIAQKEPRPAIILLDVIMPEVDGYEACRRLKENPNTALIPVIFITAKTEVEDEQKGLSLGAVDYITKPFNPDLVKARVEAQFLHYQETLALAEQVEELQIRLARAFTEFTTERLAAIIDAGEGDSVEFKSTMRWNLHADRSDKKIENGCLKTVAGYLNAVGGVLLVGVADDGEVIGLGKDHFQTEDKMLLHWVNLIKAYLGAEYLRCIRSMVHAIGGQRVLVVECLPAISPVFLNRDNEESFFVRMSNSTQALKPSEMLTYVDEHFR
jgi:putative two-component system response regulator